MIARMLKEAGYGVVEGGRDVKAMISAKADGSTEKLCSGYKVFPNGERCAGCSDCTQARIQGTHKGVGGP